MNQNVVSFCVSCLIFPMKDIIIQQRMDVRQEPESGF